jgi:hypothetical protein
MKPLKVRNERITSVEKWLGTNILQMVTEETEIYTCKCFDTDLKEKAKIKTYSRLLLIWKQIF